MSTVPKLNFKYEYMIAMILALGLGGAPAFRREDILEYMPKNYASEIRDKHVVIRTPSETPERDESYGSRIVHEKYATIKKSRVRMHYEFPIDIWLKDLDAQVSEESLGDQAEAFVGEHDNIKNDNGENVEVEFLGAGIVEDENDDFYKIVIRIKFIENKYKAEHVPLLKDENQVQIEVST